MKGKKRKKKEEKDNKKEKRATNKAKCHGIQDGQNKEMERRSGGLRDPALDAEGIDFLPLLVYYPVPVGIVVDGSGTRYKGTHEDIDAPKP